MKARLLPVAFVILGTLVLSISVADAQTSASGPYFATPSWDQTFGCSATQSCPRFIVLSNMNGDAVLDRETGLVWERTPSAPLGTQDSMIKLCAGASTGGRYGWRVPTSAELASLGDPTNDTPFQFHLPAGHPFNLDSVPQPIIWAVDRTSTGQGLIVFFDTAFNTPGINVGGIPVTELAGGWCVRGPQ